MACALIWLTDNDAGGALPMAMLHALAERIAPMGWHLELLAHVDAYPQELMGVADAWQYRWCFGHLGYPTIGRNVADAGFQALLQLMATGRAWVKLTGPYRLTREPLPYAPCDEWVNALLAAAPDRLVWGSDWPHVMLKGTMPNDADLVDLIGRWLPDPIQRHQGAVLRTLRFYTISRVTVRGDSPNDQSG